MQIIAFASFLLISACSLFHNSDQLPLPEGLSESINSSARFEENKERDYYQHPKETLEFLGIKPDMTVVEVAPGSGYYTEILAPYLAKGGQLYLAVPRLPSRPSPSMLENESRLQEILLRHEEVHQKTKLMPFEPLGKRDEHKKEMADFVLTFNNIHNWIARKEAQDSFKFCYDILKPGGILGVVQHRIKTGQQRVPKSGYLYEEEVIRLAQATGFQLLERSEINANPKDTADYPKGVWVLPPTYRLGKKDRDRYEAIGESDRMTLKFVKAEPSK